MLTDTNFQHERLTIWRQTVETFRAASNKWEKIGFVEGHGNSNSPKDYTFTDNILNLSLNPDKSGQALKLNYRLKQIDFDGNYEYSDEISVKLAENIKEYKLEQNYPNPFNPSTTIKFSIPSESKDQHQNGEVHCKLTIFNTLGQQVAEILNKPLSAGNYEIEFNAENSDGMRRFLPTGTYFYRIQIGNFTQSKKMILLK